MCFLLLTILLLFCFCAHHVVEQHTSCKGCHRQGQTMQMIGVYLTSPRVPFLACGVIFKRSTLLSSSVICFSLNPKKQEARKLDYDDSHINSLILQVLVIYSTVPRFKSPSSLARTPLLPHVCSLSYILQGASSYPTVSRSFKVALS